MTKLPEKADIRTAVTAYCAGRGLSKNQLATRLGVSGATLSNIEGGSWDNISEAMWLRVWAGVKPTNRGRLLIETDNLSEAVAMFTEVRETALLGALVGDTGLGKTTAARHYAAQPGVYYLAYEKRMRPTLFFAALLREMGVDFVGNLYAMMQRVADELRRQPRPLLLIDEAGKLPHVMLLHLHDLRDQLADECGMVLIGMPYFRANLEKAAHGQKEGYAEFLRRIEMWHDLKRPTYREVKSLCHANGLMDADAVKELHAKCRNFGTLQNDIRLKLKLQQQLETL